MPKKEFEKEKRKVVPLVQEFNHVSAQDLDEIMEWLSDNDYLSEKGIVFKYYFWQLFISAVDC